MNQESQLLDPEDLSTWRTFLRAHANVVATLDKELTRSHTLGLADYDVLSCLSNAPQQSMRMTELAYEVLLSPSGLTRRLDGLVKQGLVERKPSPADGRGLLAVLTEAGATRRQEMQPTYHRTLQTGFMEHLEPQQRKELLVMLQPIAEDQPESASRRRVTIS